MAKEAGAKKIEEVFAQKLSLSPSLEMEKPTIKGAQLPPPIWAKKMSRLIKRARSEATQELISQFEKLIKSHKEYINEKLFILDGTVFHEVAKDGVHGFPLEFVKILAENGADFGIQDAWGDTPLMWAIANANNGMAKEILRQLPPSQRSSLDKQCVGNKNSALHLVIGKGYTTRSLSGQYLSCSNDHLMGELIRLGADVNLQNKHGMTPLLLAAVRRNSVASSFLLQAGADSNCKTKKGQTAKELIEPSEDSENERSNYELAKSIISETTVQSFILDPNHYVNTEKRELLQKLLS